MAKRLNPHRRLLNAQAKALAAVRLEQSAAHSAEMSKLQQGYVRSGIAISNDPKAGRGRKAGGPSVSQMVGLKPANPIPWEGRGKVGKIVSGKFKRVQPGTKKRFSQ